MSNIRKDFERDMNPPPFWEEIAFWIGCFSHYSSGFQAGRAHDIEGLIAEIRKLRRPSLGQTNYVYRDEVIEIIRKHFGKEGL